MILLFIISSLLVGYVVNSLVMKVLSELEKWALAFPTGFGLITGVFFLISLVQDNIYGRNKVILILGLISFLSLLIIRFSPSLEFWSWFKKTQLPSYNHVLWFCQRYCRAHWLYIGVILGILSVSLLNYTWGPYDWDVITLYDMRARILASGQQLSDIYALTGNNGARYVYYFSYPLSTSIGHALIYVLGSTQVMAIYSLFYASLFSWLYLFVSKRFRKTFVKAGLFILLMITPTYFVQAQTAYTNFPYTVYLTVGMLLFFDDMRSKRTPLLAGIFIAFSMWVRFVDPFYYVFLVLSAMMAIAHRQWKYLIACIPILALRQGWGMYLAANVTPYSDSIEVFTISSIYRLMRTQFWDVVKIVPQALVFIQKIIINIMKEPVALLVLGLIIGKVQIVKKYWLELLWLVLIWGVVNAGSIVFALIYEDWAAIPGSAERMLTSLIPIVYVITAMIIDELLSKNNTSKKNMSEIKLIKSTFYNEPETKAALQAFIGRAKVLSFSQECQEFERRFAKYQGREHAVFVNSGSSANLAMIQAFLNMGKLKVGDKIGFSALTWSTNAMPLIELGLVPVPIDVEMDTLNISSRTVRNILNTTKLKGLFITNLLGFCDDIDQIATSCKENNILFFEDNCESMGSVYKGRKLGNFGIASSFSFYVGHHMSTIEGGMVCTDDEELATALRLVRAHGWDRNLALAHQQKIRAKFKVNSSFYSRYTFYDLGYNLRPTEIAGFLGNYQLQFIEEIVQKRSQNYFEVAPTIYTQSDKYFPIKHEHMDFLSNFAIPVICRSIELRDQLVKKCAGKVEIRPIVGGDMTQQPFFSKYIKSKNKTKSNATLIHEQGLYFGNNPELTKAELETIIELFTS